MHDQAILTSGLLQGCVEEPSREDMYLRMSQESLFLLSSCRMHCSSETVQTVS